MDGHFNKLTPAEAERLACIAEECGEVQQIVGKILRHGFESRHPDGGSTNRELLKLEIADFVACAALLQAAGDIDMADLESRLDRKIERLKQFTHHQPAELFEGRAS